MSLRNLFLVTLLAASALHVEAQVPSGFDMSAFDRSVRPQDDLYRYVNGGWLDRTIIPTDRRRVGVFDEISDRVLLQLRAIAEQPGKIGTFYDVFMDEGAAERQGLKPLAIELAAIDAVSSRDDLMRLFARLSLLGVRTPILPAVAADAERPEVFTLILQQGGLGLPNREYYVTDEAQFAAIRRQYTIYVATLLETAGTERAAEAAQSVVALEGKIASAHWTAAASRDVIKTYNPMPASELAQRYAAVNWPEWLQALGLRRDTPVVVGQPSYLEALSTILSSTDVEHWKRYLKAALLDRYAPYLTAKLGEAEFAFRGRVLNGLEAKEPRWRSAIFAINDSMGHLMGREYVSRHFPPESRTRMVQLIENMRLAFGQAIDEAEWMSAETKREARRKLAAFRANIGYPVKWRDFTALEVRPGDLAGNMMRAAAFEQRYQLARVGGATDPDEWNRIPQVVNAFYNARRNAITFPAGILQPPLFDPSADDAVNYGGIGTIIGHEMGHGFDDQGRRSDADGRLKDWWTTEDAANYERRASEIVKQFDAFEALPGLNVNGRLTLGENIGDLTGLVIALRAYHVSLEGRPSPVIDGMTGDQRFFAGWAQAFRDKRRIERLRELVLTDPHSPSNFRVNGPVVHMPAFYEAFGVKPGDRMYVPPERRTRIW